MSERVGPSTEPPPLCTTTVDGRTRTLDWRPGALAEGHLVADTYRVGRTLGRGGMAKVVLAHDILLDRDVALKFIGPELLADPMWRERFTAEARNIARVHHPNVVEVHTFGIHAGWPFFVLEYVDGVPLTQRARLERMPLGAVVDVVRQLASGLDAIHAAGLVHHDIKPANVMIDKEGRAVLLDFGLSQLRAGRPREKTLLGTVRYMAPEQIDLSPLPPEIAPRTDVYQLAVTTFELLTGRVPFDGKNVYAVLRMQCDAAAPRPSSLRPGLPPLVDDVMAVALSKNPLARYASAGELADALERALTPPSERWRQRSSYPARPISILVVEDDPLQLDATAALVESGVPFGSSVERASGGEEALDALAKAEFDVVVLDLHMPGLSGMDVARAVREGSFRRRPRIIVVTAEGGSDEWRDLRALGVESLLLKPFDGDQLTTTIQACITHSRRPGPVPA